MSSQSKDNTCPVCGSKNYEPALGLCTNGCHLKLRSGQQDNTCKACFDTGYVRDLGWGWLCSHGESGQQEGVTGTLLEVSGELAFSEDKPTTTVYAVEPQKLMDGCHKCKAVYPAGEKHSCDSQPEKPQEFKTIYTPEPQLSAWGEHLRTSTTPNHTHNDECKREFGFTEPSKPDQLRMAAMKIVNYLGEHWAVTVDDRQQFNDQADEFAIQAIEALISQREQEAFERGRRAEWNLHHGENE